MDIMFGAEPKGIQALISIKSAFPSVDVVMFTGKEETDMIFECIKQGASGYIRKNESLSILLEYIRMIYEGGTVFSASIGTKVRDYFQKLHQPSLDNVYALTAREVDALSHLCNGLSKKMIADRMQISIHGVAQHLRHVFEKLQVHTATEAVAKALREKLI
jgi:DNA-binding NarL/FixJ family response regulator